jgi:hypothetical protein
MIDPTRKHLESLVESMRPGAPFLQGYVEQHRSEIEESIGETAS